MRFSTIISTVAIAALAVAPAALAHNGKTEISEEVYNGLYQIKGAVNGLQAAFLKFANNGSAAAEAGAMALESAHNLSAALNTTTHALHTHHSYIANSQADEIVEVYGWISGNITIVTDALKPSVDAIVKAGARQVVEDFLPKFESNLDRLGEALKKKIPKAHMKEIKTIWHKIDDDVESTLKAFGIVDASCDSNPIARRSLGNPASRTWGFFVAV